MFKFVDQKNANVGYISNIFTEIFFFSLFYCFHLNFVGTGPWSRYRHSLWGAKICIQRCMIICTVVWFKYRFLRLYLPSAKLLFELALRRFLRWAAKDAIWDARSNRVAPCAWCSCTSDEAQVQWRFNRSSLCKIIFVGHSWSKWFKPD